jgi:hypothetical protein
MNISTDTKQIKTPDHKTISRPLLSPRKSKNYDCMRIQPVPPIPPLPPYPYPPNPPKLVRQYACN